MNTSHKNATRTVIAVALFAMFAAGAPASTKPGSTGAFLNWNRVCAGGIYAARCRSWTELNLVNSLICRLEQAMAKSINIHEAKTHLSRLVEQAAAGREIIIAKAGKPVARLMSLASPVRTKNLGLLEGEIKVPDDFNAPLDDATLALFERQ